MLRIFSSNKYSKALRMTFVRRYFNLIFLKFPYLHFDVNHVQNLFIVSCEYANRKQPLWADKYSV